METRPASEDELESCYSLLMLEITEPKENSLRVVVGETSLGELVKVDPFGTGQTMDLRPITHTESERVFAVTWDRYVSYAVFNETFAAGEAAGRHLAHLEGSAFERFVSSVTWDDERYGLRRQWRLSCENHIIEVVSTVDPSITLLTGFVDPRQPSR